MDPRPLHIIEHQKHQLQQACDKPCCQLNIVLTFTPSFCLTPSAVAVRGKVHTARVQAS